MSNTPMTWNEVNLQSFSKGQIKLLKGETMTQGEASSITPDQSAEVSEARVAVAIHKVKNEISSK